MAKSNILNILFITLMLQNSINTNLKVYLKELVKTEAAFLEFKSEICDDKILQNPINEIVRKYNQKNSEGEFLIIVNQYKVQLEESLKQIQKLQEQMQYILNTEIPRVKIYPNHLLEEGSQETQLAPAKIFSVDFQSRQILNSTIFKLTKKIQKDFESVDKTNQIHSKIVGIKSFQFLDNEFDQYLNKEYKDQEEVITSDQDEFDFNDFNFWLKHSKVKDFENDKIFMDENHLQNEFEDIEFSQALRTIQHFQEDSNPESQQIYTEGQYFICDYYKTQLYKLALLIDDENNFDIKNQNFIKEDKISQFKELESHISKLLQVVDKQKCNGFISPYNFILHYVLNINKEELEIHRQDFDQKFKEYLFYPFDNGQELHGKMLKERNPQEFEMFYELDEFISYILNKKEDDTELNFRFFVFIHHVFAKSEKNENNIFPQYLMNNIEYFKTDYDKLQNFKNSSKIDQNALRRLFRIRYLKFCEYRYKEMKDKMKKNKIEEEDLKKMVINAQKPINPEEDNDEDFKIPQDLQQRVDRDLTNLVLLYEKDTPEDLVRIQPEEVDKILEDLPYDQIDLLEDPILIPPTKEEEHLDIPQEIKKVKKKKFQEKITELKKARKLNKIEPESYKREIERAIENELAPELIDSILNIDDIKNIDEVKKQIDEIEQVMKTVQPSFQISKVDLEKSIFEMIKNRIIEDGKGNDYGTYFLDFFLEYNDKIVQKFKDLKYVEDYHVDDKKYNKYNRHLIDQILITLGIQIQNNHFHYHTDKPATQDQDAEIDYKKNRFDFKGCHSYNPFVVYNNEKKEQNLYKQALNRMEGCVSAREVMFYHFIHEENLFINPDQLLQKFEEEQNSDQD